ncbi:regulator (plasmid) [Paenibacillus peoriae]|uniref:AbrB/MazE/SpoVT family DNA-binding domain-containing protein n=1 Tax=Paenibacillus peoriae TaxID=59893 RepID=UPI000722C36B|nr:AbrB/MazE/SpoVT family DNA-binding domain-containing protein [Paenibacillus peoriae]ALS09914.1 regulator [Paenibacillus peoriae]
MKSTGMTRPLDSLGRIVIPKEIRSSMGFNIDDPVEFFADDETGFIALRKYIGVSCKMCGSIEELTYFKDSFLCRCCISDLKENVGVSSMPVTVIKEETELVRRSYQSAELLSKALKELMQKYPNAKQTEIATLLGVSPGRISQLKKLL